MTLPRPALGTGLAKYGTFQPKAASGLRAPIPSFRENDFAVKDGQRLQMVILLILGNFLGI